VARACSVEPDWHRVLWNRDATHTRSGEIDRRLDAERRVPGHHHDQAVARYGAPRGDQAVARQIVRNARVRRDQHIDRRARSRLHGEHARGAEGESHAQSRVRPLVMARDLGERIAQARGGRHGQLARLRGYRDESEEERERQPASARPGRAGLGAVCVSHWPLHLPLPVGRVPKIVLGTA
jgi:hypothetical protein